MFSEAIALIPGLPEKMNLQGCALTSPRYHRSLTFVFRQLGKLAFHITHPRFHGCQPLGSLQFFLQHSLQPFIHSFILYFAIYTYTLFDGFTDNMRGYFVSEQRVKCPRVLSEIPSNKRFIIPLHYFPAIFYYFIQ